MVCIQFLEASRTQIPWISSNSHSHKYKVKAYVRTVELVIDLLNTKVLTECAKRHSYVLINHIYKWSWKYWKNNKLLTSSDKIFKKKAKELPIEVILQYQSLDQKTT